MSIWIKIFVFFTVGKTSHRNDYASSSILIDCRLEWLYNYKKFLSTVER